MQRQSIAGRYKGRVESKASLMERKHTQIMAPDEIEEVFHEGMDS
jgi:hypothetical protein